MVPAFHDLAEPLKKASLARINISLDTLNPRTYQTITGVDALNRVVSGEGTRWK
jgi:molybdenum cofactor biosynthesis enzyme MoaA